ncbi:MAG: FAD-dependent oxidoreductase [Desulfatiglandaceae bacterium]
MFDHLFNPMSFGKVSLPNRVCFLAHRTNFSQKGRFTDRHVAYYRRRAQGGCGLIILGELCIHQNDRPWATLIDAYRPDVVQDYRKLTTAVHEFGTRVFAQLCHYGFQSNGAITRQAVWGPSAISDIAFGETAKAMEVEDMAVLVEASSRAAVLARDGGFDGLEIDMGPESLLRQFLSPLSNFRQDDYGGTLENRMRLPLEVIDGVRKAVGDDFTVGIRLCADEKFWGAITLEESRQFVQQFETEGHVDFINVTVGTYYNLYLIFPSMHTAPGFTIETAEEMKKAVTIPVIASHQVDFPQMAEDILSEGHADAVGLVRSLICDPDAPKKAREGRVKDIRYCVRDNEGCIGRVTRFKTLSCIQNPDVGNEEFESEKSEGKNGKAEERESRNRKSIIQKRVMVVGAGPAGLEAALVAREKGHKVTVYEKEDVIGGQVNLATKGAGRLGMGEIIRYLQHMLERLKVPIITGIEVTQQFVLREKPDAVIVATGSKPHPRPVAGEYGPPLVLNVHEVLADGMPIGARVLFIDENGGHHATATVELLADQGKRVDMITSDLFVGVELGPLGDLYLTRQRLLQKGVTFTTDVVLDEIDDKRAKAHYIYTNEPLVLDGYDTIVLDMGNEVVDRLYKQLKGQMKELYRIGDCVAPRGIDMAILEGKKVGEIL